MGENSPQKNAPIFLRLQFGRKRFLKVHFLSMKQPEFGSSGFHPCQHPGGHRETEGEFGVLLVQGIVGCTQLRSQRTPMGNPYVSQYSGYLWVITPKNS